MSLVFDCPITFKDRPARWSAGIVDRINDDQHVASHVLLYHMSQIHVCDHQVTDHTVKVKVKVMQWLHLK